MVKLVSTCAFVGVILLPGAYRSMLVTTVSGGHLLCQVTTAGSMGAYFAAGIEKGKIGSGKTIVDLLVPKRGYAAALDVHEPMAYDR